MYTVIFTSPYDKEYESLPLAIRKRADQQIERLRVNPHHPSLRTHQRIGYRNLWQPRVTRNYRLYFSVEGETITLISVGPHEK